jgi:soluble epoxide hydrolase / lipid-phosphate phosphatase
VTKVRLAYHQELGLVFMPKTITAAIPKERHKLTHPVLQVTALRDAICLPEIAKNVAAAFCTNATVRELDAGHWLMLEKPRELNAVLDEFLESL